MSLAIWMTTLTLSIAAMILMAAADLPLMHMLVAFAVNVAFAYMAVNVDRKSRAEGVGELTIASDNARAMGLVWLWAGITMFVTYMFILQWKEWIPFFVALMVVGATCLFLSDILKRDAEKDAENSEGILKIARYLTVGQLVGMLIAMVGLFLDGKMQRYENARVGWEDWAANNIFFFCAMALAVISANALLSGKSQAPQT